MPVTLGSSPQPDFDRPLDLMMDCHRRVERFLEILCRVAIERSGGELGDEYRQGLETALDYFTQAAPRHTADEEQSLFPRLRASDTPDAREALALIERLEADHAEAGPIHDRIDALGRQWLDENRLSGHEAGELVTLVQRLRASYLEHIRIEDEQVFPAAARALDAASLEAVGQEMRDRRRLAPGRAGSRCAQRRQEQLGEA